MSQFDIDVVPELRVEAERQDIMRQAAIAVLDKLGQKAGGCTILLAGDERIRELNRTFLGSDKATDVLSFPIGEETPGAEGYLGDIVISIPSAERQSKEGGHSLNAELQLLAVHAVLHLLGYDHAGESDKEVMWSVQSEILAGLGAEITEPQSD